MDTELAPFQSLKRPLVVSFRRIPKDNNGGGGCGVVSGGGSGLGSFNSGFDVKNQILQNEITNLKYLKSPSGNKNKLTKDSKMKCQINRFHLRSGTKFFNRNKKVDGTNINAVNNNTTIINNINTATAPSILSNSSSSSTCRRNNKGVGGGGGFVDDNSININDDNNLNVLMTLPSSLNNNLRQTKNKYPSETNLVKNDDVISCIFYPTTTIKSSINNLKQIEYFNYKSPYESPELSKNSKKLEENLRKILEDLVLYPKGCEAKKNLIINTKQQQQSQQQQQQQQRLTATSSTSSSSILKSQSLPSINFVELYPGHEPSQQQYNNNNEALQEQQHSVANAHPLTFLMKEAEESFQSRIE